MVLGKLDCYLKPCTKTNSKWIRDLNIRLETIRFLEENTVSRLFGIGLGDDFLCLTPKAQINKGAYMK